MKRFCSIMTHLLQVSPAEFNNGGIGQRPSGRTRFSQVDHLVAMSCSAMSFAVIDRACGYNSPSLTVFRPVFTVSFERCDWNHFV